MIRSRVILEEGARDRHGPALVNEPRFWVNEGTMNPYETSAAAFDRRPMRCPDRFLMWRYAVAALSLAALACGNVRHAYRTPREPSPSPAPVQPYEESLTARSGVALPEAVVSSAVVQRLSDDARDSSEEAEAASEKAAPNAAPVPSSLGSARAAVAAAQASPPASSPEKIVINGNVSYVADDLNAAVIRVRAEVRRLGGTIASDRFEGSAERASWELVVRLPPDKVEAFLAALSGVGRLEGRDLMAQEVTRQFFDQELRLHNLRVTNARLEKLLVERPNAPLNDVLAIEREMQRVRGELEAVEGEHRYLSDRIARASIGVTISSRPRPAPTEPRASFLIVPRANVWHFLDSRDERHQDRFGFAASLLFGSRVDLTLDVLPRHDGDARSYLASLGVGLFSDFLGGGHRRVLNPYLGARLGYGDINDRSTFAFGAEAGVELVRLPSLVVDLAGRIYGFRYKKVEGMASSDVSTQVTLGIGVPF